jgi:hypothetical protein
VHARVSRAVHVVDGHVVPVVDHVLHGGDVVELAAAEEDRVLDFLVRHPPMGQRGAVRCGAARRGAARCNAVESVGVQQRRKSNVGVATFELVFQQAPPRKAYQTPDTRHRTLKDTGHQTPDTRHQTPDTRHQALTSCRPRAAGTSTTGPWPRSGARGSGRTRPCAAAGRSAGSPPPAEQHVKAERRPSRCR